MTFRTLTMDLFGCGSIGKRIAGIRVVDKWGAKPAARLLIKRNLILGMAGFQMFMFSLFGSVDSYEGLMLRRTETNVILTRSQKTDNEAQKSPAKENKIKKILSSLAEFFGERSMLVLLISCFHLLIGTLFALASEKNVSAALLAASGIIGLITFFEIRVGFPRLEMRSALKSEEDGYAVHDNFLLRLGAIILVIGGALLPFAVTVGIIQALTV